MKLRKKEYKLENELTSNLTYPQSITHKTQKDNSRYGTLMTNSKKREKYE